MDYQPKFGVDRSAFVHRAVNMDGTGNVQSELFKNVAHLVVSETIYNDSHRPFIIMLTNQHDALVEIRVIELWNRYQELVLVGSGFTIDRLQCIRPGRFVS